MKQVHENGDPHLFQAYRYEISRIIVKSYKFQYISTVLCGRLFRDLIIQCLILVDY